MADSTKRIEIIIDGRDNASGALGGVGGALGNILQIASGIIGARIFEKIWEGITNIASSAISATAQLQAMQVGLEGLVMRELRYNDASLSVNEALLRAQPLAKGLMDELARVAILSPYQLAQVQNTFRMGMAFGFTTDQAKEFTAAILNMAAGVGADASMLDRMAYNLAQVRLQGKVTQMDVRQLAQAGLDLVGVLKYMGQQHGVVIEDIGDFNAAMADGRLEWKDFASDFEKYADENFGGASERMSRTLQGLKSTMSDLFILTMPTLIGPAVEKFTGFANTVLNKFLEIRDSGVLEAWGQKIGENFEKTFGPLMNIITVLIGAGDASLTFRDALSQAFGPGIGDAILKVIDLFKALGGSNPLGPELQNFLTMIFGAQSGTTIFDGLVTTFATLKTGMAGFQAFFSGDLLGILQTWGQYLYSVFSQVATFVASNVVPFLAEQFAKVGAWFKENGPLIQDFLSTIANVMTTYVIPAVLGLWSVISSLLNGIVDMYLGLGKTIMQLVTGDFSGAWETLKKVLTRDLETIRTVIVNLLNWIAGLFGSSLSEIGATWSGVWEAMKMTVSLVWGIIKGFFIGIWGDIVNIWNGIVLYFQNAWSNIVFVVQTVGLVLLGAIFTLWDWILGFFGTSIADLSTRWLNGWNNIGQILSDAWARIVTFWTNAWATFSAFWTGVWNTVVSILATQGIKLVVAGSTVITNLWNGIKAIWAYIVSWWSGVLTAFKDTVVTFYTPLFNVGKSLIQGLWNGLKSMWASVASWWSDTVERLIQKAKDILGIASPSSVFAGIGQNLMAGLANGIKNGLTLPINAVVGVGNDLIGTGTNIFGGNTDTRTSIITIPITISGSGDPQGVVDELMRQFKLQGIKFQAGIA